MTHAAVPRLAIFVYDLSATGVVKNALAVARHMHSSGWAVSLVVCCNEGQLAHQVQGLNLRILNSSSWKGIPRVLDLLRNVIRLRRLLGTLRPDVLMSAGNHAHFSCWLATRGRTQPPTVYRISNDLAQDQSRLRLGGRQLVMRLILKDAARTIIVSQSLAADPALADALDSGKAVVISNGVDVEEAITRAADPAFTVPWCADSTPVVLAVGRLVKQKNFKTLIRAAGIAHQVKPLRLVILGAGSRRQKKEMIALAHECGLGEQMELPGVCENPFAAMRYATTLVVPSLWEGASNVLLEALAVGTPVIASHSAGNARHVLDDGRYGLLIDPLDVTAMADAILQQMDPDRSITPASRAIDFDRKVSLNRYRLVLDEVVTQTYAQQ